MTQKLDRFLTRLTQGLVVLLFLAMVVLVFAQVYTRFLTNNSLVWSEELSRFLMIWMVFLASALAFKENSHICVDNLVKALPNQIARMVKILAIILELVFLAVLLWGAYVVLPTTSLQRSPANGIMMAYIYAAIPVCAILMSVTALKNLFDLFQQEGGNTRL